MNSSGGILGKIPDLTAIGTLKETSEGFHEELIRTSPIKESRAIYRMHLWKRPQGCLKECPARMLEKSPSEILVLLLGVTSQLEQSLLPKLVFFEHFHCFNWELPRKSKKILYEKFFGLTGSWSRHPRHGMNEWNGYLGSEANRIM